MKTCNSNSGLCLVLSDKFQRWTEDDIDRERETYFTLVAIKLRPERKSVRPSVSSFEKKNLLFFSLTGNVFSEERINSFSAKSIGRMYQVTFYLKNKTIFSIKFRLFVPVT